MTRSASDCQVLVVGAGPTGLVLAAELLARGIDTRIIDKGEGVFLQSRATGVHARTLEVLDAMGLAEQFIERGQIVRRFRYYSADKPLVNLDLSRTARVSASCSIFRNMKRKSFCASESSSWAASSTNVSS